MSEINVHTQCTFHVIQFYRTLQVTFRRLGAWLSCCGECRHGYTFLNLVTAAPNLIKTLYNIFRRPQLQTKSFPIPYFHWQVTYKALCNDRGQRSTISACNSPVSSSLIPVRYSLGLAVANQNAALWFCVPLCSNRQLVCDQLHNIAVKSCTSTTKKPFQCWVFIKRGTGNEEIRNGKWGNEEMNWKWSSKLLYAYPILVCTT